MMKLPRFVTTITPQRVSFAGGGTDFREFYSLHGGAVVSATIDKFCYVTVKRHSELFKEKFRLSYSESEHVNDLNEMKNDIARECLRLLNVEPPLFISTTSDLPLSSGLGSSSSFAVGLLLALHNLRGEEVTAGQIAEEACHIEIDVLGKPIGKQDQYAAAFGGLNYYDFRKDGRVRVESLWSARNDIQKLFESCILFWTGIQRNAEDVLGEQKENIPHRIDSLKEMSEIAKNCRSVVLDSENIVNDLSELINMGWSKKRNLASTISSTLLDDAVERAMSEGALGVKIAGAGGGGFLFVLMQKDSEENIINALSDMTAVKINYYPGGAKVLVSL